MPLLGGAWGQMVGTGFTRAARDNFEDGARTSESTGTKVKLDYQSTVRFATPSFADADHAVTFYAEREYQEFRNRRAAVPATDQDRDTTDYGFVGEYRLDLWELLFRSGAARYADTHPFRRAPHCPSTTAPATPDSGPPTTVRYA